jgi:hypothetical protein
MYRSSYRRTTQYGYGVRDQGHVRERIRNRCCFNRFEDTKPIKKDRKSLIKIFFHLLFVSGDVVAVDDDDAVRLRLIKLTNACPHPMGCSSLSLTNF